MRWLVKGAAVSSGRRSPLLHAELRPAKLRRNHSAKTLLNSGEDWYERIPPCAKGSWNGCTLRTSLFELVVADLSGRRLLTVDKIH